MLELLSSLIRQSAGKTCEFHTVLNLNLVKVGLSTGYQGIKNEVILPVPYPRFNELAGVAYVP